VGEGHFISALKKCHTSYISNVSDEKSADIQTVFSPTGKVSCFFYCFQDFSFLSVTQRSLIIMCLSVNFLVFILYEVYPTSLSVGLCLWPNMENFSHYSLNTFSALPSSSFENVMTQWPLFYYSS
jgi:hypothetical protein